MLAILLIPNVIKIYNSSVEREMKVQEGTVLSASNLLINDYCKKKIDARYECPDGYQEAINNKKYVCLDDLYYTQSIIETVNYKRTECEGMVAYDKNENPKYTEGKAYLYCGKDSNGNYAYMTDENVPLVREFQSIGKVAEFDTGENVNIRMKQLANPTVTNITKNYLDTNVVAILRSKEEPSSENKEAKNKVSAVGSPYDIYVV